MSSGDRRGDRRVEGGWLRRIATGTSAVFSEALVDPDPDTPGAAPVGAPTPPPPMTPRLLTILRPMVPVDVGGEPPWVFAADLAHQTGVGRDTVTQLLARLESYRWAESDLDDQEHVRRYRLTATGVDGACTELAAVSEPEPVRRRVARREPVRHESAGREPARSDMPALSAQFIAEAPRDRRGWFMSDLASLNADLAAAVRRKLADGR